MSHTRRRRHEHTPHKRGRFNTEQPVPRAARPRRGGSHRRAAAIAATSVVSDHAIVRWLERVEGVDVRAGVEALILAEGREELIASVQNGRIRLHGTRIALVIRNGTVVSVVREEAQEHG